MKKLLIVSCFALSACSSAPQIAATATPIFLPPEKVEKIRVTCNRYGPVLEFASSPGMPEILSSTAIDAAAYCKQLNAGFLPPTTDAKTPDWFDRIIAALPTVAQAAGILLR